MTDATEQDSIIASLQSALWEIAWNDDGDHPALVSENLREMADLERFPAIFIIDLGCIAERATNRPNPVEDLWTWRICLGAFLQAENENSAPKELRAFEKLMYAKVYAQGRTIGRSYKATIRVVEREPILFPDLGNNVIARGTIFEIKYPESVAI